MKHVLVNINSILEDNRKVFLILFFLAIVLYANTLSHDYALDDAIVITKNEFTKQGFEGVSDIFLNESFTGFFGRNKELVSGGRYRPLSIATYAIEYELFGQKPMVSHLINVLFYGLIVFLIFIWIKLLFVNYFKSANLSIIAFFSAFIFLIHPVHTECVANIKGRDELLSLLFSLLAFVQVIYFKNKGQVVRLAFAALLFFLALLSKENAIAFLLIIPLGIYLFAKTSLQKVIFIIGGLLSAVLLFLVIRSSVLGGINFQPPSELMNNPFLDATLTQKYATILYTWLLYLKLLVFPHPLTFDYYPYHIPLMQFNSFWVILTLLIIISLLVLMFLGFKRNKLLAFVIVSFASSFFLVSNLFFSVGTFMNERFVFMPSLFWCIVIAYCLVQMLENKRWISIISIFAILYMAVFYPLKTIARNKAWQNDFTLFTTDVKVSSNSAKSTCSAGGKYWEEAKKLDDGVKKSNYFNQSEQLLRKSLKIHPKYVDAWLLLGNVLFDARKDIEGSVTCYLNVIKLQPENSNGWENIDIVLQNSTDRKLQLQTYHKLYAVDSSKYIVNYRLGVLYGRYLNDLNRGIGYLENAVEIDDSKLEALKDLGTAYGIAEQPHKAYVVLKQALDLNKNDKQIIVNLGLACQHMGNIDEANAYFSKAKQLEAK